MSNVLCTICARGSSKGVPSKNIRSINGIPLIVYSIQQAFQSKLFDFIVVSTDSDDITKIARDAGAEVFFKRPDYLSNDTVGKLDVIRHAHIESERYYNNIFDFHIDLDATSPLRTPEDIIKAFEQFSNDHNDILITGTPSRRSPYFNIVEKNGDDFIELSKTLHSPVVRRQDSPQCFDMNASIYIWKRDALINGDSLFTKKTGLYIMPEERSIDIDSELDFSIVEFLLKGRSNEFAQG